MSLSILGNELVLAGFCPSCYSTKKKPRLEQTPQGESVCPSCGIVFNTSTPIAGAVIYEGRQPTSPAVFGKGLGCNYETHNPDGSSNMYALHGDNGKFRPVLNSPMTREMTMKGTEEADSVIASLKQSIVASLTAPVFVEQVDVELSAEEIARKGRIETKDRFGRKRVKLPKGDEFVSIIAEPIVKVAEEIRRKDFCFRITRESHQARNKLLTKVGSKRYGAAFLREQLKHDLKHSETDKIVVSV